MVAPLAARRRAAPSVSDLFGKKGLAWLKEEPDLPDSGGCFRKTWD
jgi:hypothetical protein